MFKVGFGYDVHAFLKEQTSKDSFVTLCGVEIPHTHKLKAHSDGDVAVHALVDAMLGAACIEGCSDIGQVFPDSDLRWKDKNSMHFLLYAKKLIEEHGFYVKNIDFTIVCQSLRISPHKESMRKSIKDALNLKMQDVSVKATTTERLGFEGRCEGISAYAIVLLGEK